MNEQLQKKVNSAIRLLKQAEKSAERKGQPVEIAVSGGKDSDVILRLAQLAEINYRAIYRDTSIDPPYTHKHIKEIGAERVAPKQTFLQIIKKKGFPSRVQRHCCAILKEYKILDVCVMGVRRAESVKRAERYSEPTECRFYGSKKNHVEAFYPILEWTNQDVADFIAEQKMKCHPLYYDDKGNFHVERRLGCLGCPIASRNNRLKEFKRYPNLVKMYAIGGGYWLDNHQDSKNAKHFRNVYEWITMSLFCDSMAEFHRRFGANLFQPNGTDCKEFLEQYFNIKF